MSRDYLVIYDYGTGGAWAKINAASAEEITARYPLLKVFAEPPPWMSADEYVRIARITLEETPPQWLQLAMNEYRKPGEGRASESGE